MSRFEDLLAATALTSLANQAQKIADSSNDESQTESKKQSSRFPVQVCIN